MFDSEYGESSVLGDKVQNVSDPENGKGEVIGDGVDGGLDREPCFRSWEGFFVALRGGGR